VTEIHPAATVVLIRDSKKGIETLLLRRSKKLDFVGGAWVFPGGRIDPTDYSHNQPDDMESGARRAAVREAGEEADIQIDPNELVYFSHWITPEESTKRFDTWFFIAAVDSMSVKVDGNEIHEYMWIKPSDALESQRDGRIQLMPPTFVSLQELSRFNRVSAVLDYFRSSPPTRFLPRIVIMPGGVCSLYQGDGGYDTKDPDKPGPRHRFWMMDSGWYYEKIDLK
jgi:8-oxo-dGTP pyrophosphatase MutT (NUDIX family)